MELNSVSFLITHVYYLNISILRQREGLLVYRHIEQIVLASGVYKFRKLESQPKCSIS